MSAKARDLLKTRPNRVGEVLHNIALGAGQANGQVLVDGNDLSVNATNTKFDVAKGEYTLAQSLVTAAAVAAINVDAGATTAAGQFCKVLLQRDAAGAVTQVVGAFASTQALAVTPDVSQDPAKIAIGWIEIPASFTPGTTAVTAGMLKAMPYTG